MRRFGIIGYPVAGTRSPMLFSKAYDGKYPYDIIENPLFDACWEKFLKEYEAINITAPFKEMAFRRLIECGGTVSDDVRRLGAINIAVKAGDSFVGANSDYLGVKALLPEATSHAATAVIAGCGGAGKAAAAAASDRGYRLILMNRTPEKAKSLAETFSGAISAPLSELPDAFGSADLLIYNIPSPIPELLQLLSHIPKLSSVRESSRIPEFGGSATGGTSKIILEANYRTPSFSGALLDGLKSRGINYIHGSYWLLQQAIHGYSLMTGEQPNLSGVEL